MKKQLITFFTVAAIVSTLLFSLPPVIGAGEVKVFVAGDSTAAGYTHTGANNRYPLTGWAQVFQHYFSTEDVIIKNYAVSGRSSKSFREADNNYAKIQNELAAGDYFLIQFGHNDQKTEDATRYTNPAGDVSETGSFKNSLKYYIDLAQSKGAHPILATSISRRQLSDPGLEAYVNATRALGAELDIPVIDLYSKTNGWINEVGTAAATDLYLTLTANDYRFTSNLNYADSQYYSAPFSDNTHLNFYGADLVAQWAAEELAEIEHPLAAYVNEYQAEYPLPKYEPISPQETADERYEYEEIYWDDYEEYTPGDSLVGEKGWTHTPEDVTGSTEQGLNLKSVKDPAELENKVLLLERTRQHISGTSETQTDSYYVNFDKKLDGIIEINFKVRPTLEKNMSSFDFYLTTGPLEGNPSPYGNITGRVEFRNGGGGNGITYLWAKPTQAAALNYNSNTFSLANTGWSIIQLKINTYELKNNMVGTYMGDTSPVRTRDGYFQGEWKIGGFRIDIPKKDAVQNIYIDDLSIINKTFKDQWPPMFSELSGGKTLNALTESIILPSTYSTEEGEEYTIAWESGNKDVISDSGAVNRSILGTDQAVALTATFTPVGGGEAAERTYNARVLAPGESFSHQYFDNATETAKDWSALNSVNGWDGWKVDNQTVTGSSSTTIDLDPDDMRNKVLRIQRFASPEKEGTVQRVYKTVNTNTEKLNGIAWVSARVRRQITGNNVLSFTVCDTGGYAVNNMLADIQFYTDGRIYRRGPDNGSGGGVFSGYPAPNTNQWYNLSIRFDIPKKEFTLFIDGAIIGTSKISAGCNEIGSVRLEINRMSSGGALETEWLIDDITVREGSRFAFVCGDTAYGENGLESAVFKTDLADKGFTAYAALYTSDGAVEDISLVPISSGAAINSRTGLSLAFPDKDLTGYTVKMFVWEDGTLCPAMELYDEEI